MRTGSVAIGTRCVFVCLLAACGGDPAQSPRTAERNDANADDAEAALARLPPALRERFETMNGRQELTRALEDAARLKREARTRKLHEKPEIQTQVRELEDRLIVQQLLNDEVAAHLPDEAAQKKFWQENPSLFQRPERVRAARVFVAAREDAAKARQRAETLRVRWVGGEALAVLAKDSDGGDRVRGGDIGFLTLDHRDAALAKAAFALEKGQISAVVATDGGFSVVTVTDRLPAGVIPFEEARPEVVARMKPLLERKAFDALVARLREERD